MAYRNFLVVTVIKFGHTSSDLLAYGACDGSLTVCNVSSPPSVLEQLVGHSKQVTDLDFSAKNHYIASSSSDKRVRVWIFPKAFASEGCMASLNNFVYDFIL